MAGDSWTIRVAKPDDGGFIGDMLVEVVNWPPERNLSREQVLSTPKMAHYVTGWPRPGDLGVIAESGGQPVGAAWLRYFPASDLADGFVADDVPELAIGVTASWRGRGVGRALLRAIADQARSAGIKKISLSVERRNSAHGLYLAEGYKVVAPGTTSDIMIKKL